MAFEAWQRAGGCAAAAGVLLLAACSRQPAPEQPLQAAAPEPEAAPTQLAGGPPPSSAEPSLPAEAQAAGPDQPELPAAPADAASAPATQAAPAAAVDAATADTAPAVARIDPSAGHDPLQALNRRLYGVDRVVMRVADAPLKGIDAHPRTQPALKAVRNAFANLDEPSTAVNSVLQRRPRAALRAAARFVINSTVGLVGLFDVADRMGMRRARQDFGRTLGVYGVKPGPFVYVPLAGPTSARDFFGSMVDGLLSPTRWLHLPIWEHQARTVVVRQMRRSELQQATAQASQASPSQPGDDYALMRRTYYARRAGQVATASQPGSPTRSDGQATLAGH